MSKKYFCPRCNNEIFLNDTFCKKCGQPLVWENSNLATSGNNSEPKFLNKWVWLASGGLVFLNISNRLLFNKYFHPVDFILTNVVNFFFYALIFALIGLMFRKIKKKIKS